MAVATGRRPKATSVSKQAVDQAGVLLQQLPEKPRESLSLRDAIDQLQDEIKDALAKGYTYIDLVSLLANKGIEISPATLKRYVSMGRGKAAKTRKSAAKTGTRRTRRVAESSGASEAEDSVTSDEPKSETTELPTKATRKRSSATQAAKAEPAEAMSESPAKQTSRRRTRGSAPKTTSRTSGRGRKKSL
jgi:hypothetical protein